MTKINDFNNPIDKTFINYFPNYLKKDQIKEQQDIEDIYLINENKNLTVKEEVKNNVNKTVEKNEQSVPVNLFMEDNVNKVSSTKNLPFGPTNLPKNVEELYINPRYL